MLYHILDYFRDQIPAFRVFGYITFRTFAAILTAVAISLALGPWLIRRLQRYHIGQPIRQEGPETHFQKAGTPTMGGLLILIAVFVATLLWGDLTNEHIWIVLLSTAGFGVIGFLDDHLKLVKKHSEGLKAVYKLSGQLLISLLVGLYIYFNEDGSFMTTLSIPFLKDVYPDLGVWYIPFIIIVISSTSNAVNLTDGLDGLAIGPTIVAAFSFAGLAYVTGHSLLAEYLNITYIPGAGELTVFCGTILGAGLGFLWFNTFPAQVFMGDIGSLSLGGALGTIAVLTKHEMLLVIICGLFVMEALSVVIQVASFKLTGKRVFRMAPIHHHFELKGWEEPKVIVRFWIISILLALMSLATLKIR
ncbi:phospho-N-acetylmuramoyl-pentapeptide-transferase [candidate division KSB3 bacterium]|uniref:Phospho-N-acetylmuramoyl-pentapeptide-transferase n=1 Tax=candidate division KSB3 bacterium TaxID=2044937 RepID=A0A2G6E5I7_9BACT|nr:MAG: phospho-N-acetylmuramoyl-pentapeptide-transferase [candidate division KSB3 bacterium]PIE29792.1 MAG: phospho-N-acetylmuramoyl-pentapeptide-transferase [candidate division KSB3 bacterium]